jgi:RNA polymerase sigma-70 factor (ECF subfamily)
VFELQRKEGLSYKEIGKVLDLSIKTVENHIGQAIKYLREQLGQEKKL